MKIEELMSVPSDFEKVYDDVFEAHQNFRGTIILTWRDKNNQILERKRVDKQKNGWSFYSDSQNIIWFYFVKDGISLFEEKIAICSFSEKGEER